MAVEENSNLNKYLYKLLIIVIKHIPMVIALCYMLNISLYYIGIDLPILSNIAGVSLLTWAFLYLSSIVFRFCSYHRMFLWYILANDLLSTVDYYIGLPFTIGVLFDIHFTLIGILVFSMLYIYLKSKSEKNDTINKEDVTGYNPED